MISKYLKGMSFALMILIAGAHFSEAAYRCETGGILKPYRSIQFFYDQKKRPVKAVVNIKGDSLVSFVERTDCHDLSQEPGIKNIAKIFHECRGKSDSITFIVPRVGQPTANYGTEARPGLLTLVCKYESDDIVILP